MINTLEQPKVKKVKKVEYGFDTKGLLPPQIPHVARLLDSLYLNGFSCDLSQTGTGKMYCGSAIARAMGKEVPIIVIAPRKILNDWREVLAKYNSKPTVCINYEKITRGNTPWLKYDEKSEDYQMLKRIYCIPDKKDVRYLQIKTKFPAGSLVILDESHKCKGFNTLNAGLMIAAKRQGFRVLTLSATQATNPTEMLAFGYLTNLHGSQMYGPQWKEWAVEEGGAQYSGHHGSIVYDNEDRKAMEKMKAIHRNLFWEQKCASRLTRSMMKGLFPKNQIIARAWDMDERGKKIKAIYDAMEQAIAKIHERTDNYAAHILAEITKARRLVEIQKCPTFVEMAEDLFDEGCSPVIFLNYQDSIDFVLKMLNKNKKLRGKIGWIYGGQHDVQRYRFIQEFREDKLRIMVCNIQAGGDSISLHDVKGGTHPRRSIISPNFSAIQLLQSMGRIDRQGALTDCIQWIIFAAGTIEEKACRRVQGKVNNLECLNDGDLTMGLNFFGRSQ